MATKIVNTNFSDINVDRRLEPKFFLFKKTFEEAKKRYNFIKIGDIDNEVLRGQSPKPNTYLKDKKNNYIFIRTADVKKNQINFQTLVHLDKNTFDTQKRNRITKGDILISVVGNYLGSTAVIPNNIELGAFNDNSARIRVKNSKFSSHFISYFLNSKFGQELIQSLLTRTGQKILSAGNVKKLEIPEIEQKDILMLSLEKERKEIDSLLLIEKAKEIFYKKINIDFSKVKKEKIYSVNLSDFSIEDLWTPAYSFPLYKKTLKEIKNKWKTVVLGKIASLKEGDEVGSDNYNKYLDKKDDDAPFIRTSDIVNYEVDQFPDFYIPTEIHKELKQDIREGDILFNNDGKIGLVAMLTPQDRIILQSHIRRIRLREDALKENNLTFLTPEYIFLVLAIKEIGKYQAEKYTVVQSTIPTISNHLYDFEIPVLDKNSINEITSIIKESFKLKNEKKILVKEINKKIDELFNF